MRRTFEMTLGNYVRAIYEVEAEISVRDGEIRSITDISLSCEGSVKVPPSTYLLEEILAVIGDRLERDDLREIEGLDCRHAAEEAAEHESERERDC